MLIRDLHNFRHHFYELVKREKHTTIFVNLDVDALCACYILMHAFNCDNVSYTVNPIDSWTSLQNSLLEYCAHSSYIILINCGAYRSFLSIDLPENVTVFVIDSQRPFHLDNVFNRDAIQLLAYSSEIESWKLPKVEDVYASDTDESDEDEEDDDEEDPMRERARIADRIAERALRRQQKAQWKRNRANVLWEYYMKTWYSTPVSVMVLELAHELNKCDAGMMWCAAVGLSSQLADKLISMESYNKVCVDRMRPFIRKYSPRNQQAQCKGDDVMKISFEADLLLPVYTHWTLYDNAKETFYDRFMASRFILDKFLAGECAHETLNNAIQNYKVGLKAITSMVFTAVSQSHVINCSTYFLLVVHATSDSIYLTSRHCLFSFAHFIQRAFASARNARRMEKPLVVAVPLGEPDAGWFWVTGLMPLAEYIKETEWKSIFPRAFEHVAERSNIMIKRDSFDPNIIMVKSEERTKFFNNLDAILEASEN
uniref:Uncharacterized protein n=1 Tax=Acrobeloides nanus TaxID=290746 RepID=A0A914E1S7_9BILA